MSFGSGPGQEGGAVWLGRAHLAHLHEGIAREWLVTNGIGGFASSTVIGANTRRYHGLLVAALAPPRRRHLAVSKFEEELDAGAAIYALSTNIYPGAVHPQGHAYLQEFALDPFPRFVYGVPGILLEKSVHMVRWENVSVVTYTLVRSPGSVCLRIRPLVGWRDYHALLRHHQARFAVETLETGVVVRAQDGAVPVWIIADAGFFREDGRWFLNLEYPEERRRGLDYQEDLFSPGWFVCPLEPGQTVALVASVGPRPSLDWRRAREAEALRLARVSSAVPADDFARALARAADAFLVGSGPEVDNSVIAGYHWFTDWGRDAMVSLPGLALVTGRIDECRRILQSFGSRCQEGLVPNFVSDEGEALYNSVDASLWFVYCVHKFLQYTLDWDFVCGELYAVLRAIIASYLAGTRFGIGVEADGLLRAGEKGFQLTWMDAKVEDWVVTPRQGKAVEVNALWYNALRVVEMVARAGGDDGFAARCASAAATFVSSFEREFWNPRPGCLYDVVGETRDARVRPNQVIAVSLPFSPVTPRAAGGVLETVWRELYATYGLRTLSPRESGYRGRYCGDRRERDASYHQGTAWPWMLGQFVTAVVRHGEESAASRGVGARLLSPFRAHLAEAGMGSVSEVFDGDAPHAPGGCIAQAWSVGELLRAYVEDVLGCRPQGGTDGR